MPPDHSKKTKELFIVEGLSAASTLQQAINPRKHHVLPLQGKLINVDKASDSKVMANDMCRKLLTTLACDVGKDCDPAQLAFSSVIILTDPDMDGTHSRLLLLMFFKRYLASLLEAGLVSLIIPPLYRVHCSLAEASMFAWDDKEKQTVMRNYPAGTAQAVRLKGLAQFNTSECEHLFLNPDSRRRFQVHLVGGNLQLISGEAYAGAF